MDNKKVKYLIMDVDGTLTDGKIYMTNVGEFCKAFNIKDGCGIHDIIIPIGILPIIITGRESIIVKKRCKELGIKKIYQGVTDKVKKLIDIDIDFSLSAYIGDDINDILCMKQIKKAGGIVGCPNDAVKEVLEIADYIAEHKGGDGAVRDFIEYIVKKYNK